MSHQIFLRVVDAVGLHQQAHVVLKLGVTRKRIGNAGARKVLKYLGAIALVAGIESQPERRIGGQRHDVRQKIAHRIHDADGGFAVLDAHMHMQAEDEVGAGHQLQILHHLVIARVRINLLRAPVGKGMRGAGHQLKVMLAASLIISRRSS